MIELMGPNKPGRARLYGPGVTKTQVTKFTFDLRRMRDRNAKKTDGNVKQTDEDYGKTKLMIVPESLGCLELLFKDMLLNITKNSSSKFPPPGPWKIPIIGNIFSMVSRQPPHHVLRNLALKHGPLMHLQLGEVSALIVSSPQVAKEIMIKNDVAFADRPEIQAGKIIMYNNSDIAFSPYGNYWRQLRKICNLELLSAKKVQSFSYIREEEVKSMIEVIVSSSGSPINLIEKIFTLTNTITSRAAFGKVPKDQDLLVKMLQDLSIVAGGFDIADLFPSYKFLHVITRMSSKMANIHQNLDKILNNVIAEHEKDKENTKGVKVSGDKEDLLDILFRLKDSGELEFPITTDTIKAVILDVFSAGTDTTSSTVDWVMSELLRNPEVLKKAQAEVREVFKVKPLVQETKLKYLNMIIKETLRLHPSGPLLLPRECRESCEINGYIIPLKTKVIVNAWAIGRDPEYWYDADRFLPERFENSSIDFLGNNLEYIPFGAGRRMCPGILFGVANVEIILSSLLYHFDWKVYGGMKPEDLDMSETFGASSRRKNNLYLIASPYTPV
ncbi:premnaspirodiene oxygenase-like [Rutidosis leptorrhynchoides]|uniref:premnaspirodiene oxygenase-like n=1 Tax=Rutidosis leptorrhynchoides TaxID=125765 RepID=UPI003A990A1F